MILLGGFALVVGLTVIYLLLFVGRRDPKLPPGKSAMVASSFSRQRH